MLNIQSLIRFPIPDIKNKETILQRVTRMMQHEDEEIQKLIDIDIFRMYGFNEQEIVEIQNV